MTEQKHTHTILVVDDEPGPRQAIQMILQDKYNVLTCDNAQEAMDVINLGMVDIVFLDIRMPGFDGVEFLSQLKETATDVEIALITGYPSTQSAIRAMQHGAYDYVIKPFDKNKIEKVAQIGIKRRTKRKREKKITADLLSETFQKETLRSNLKTGKQEKDYSHFADSQKAAQAVYARAIKTIEILLEKMKTGQDLNPYMEKIDSLLDEVFNQLLSGNALLDNLYEAKGYQSFKLSDHIVNLLILSLFLGISMKLDRTQLRQLGLSCVFCDLGMDQLRGVIEKPRKLTAKEFDSVKSHVYRSLGIAEKVVAVNVKKQVIEAILAHHERVDGTGYPRGLKGSTSINLLARIVGLADTYEAITHQRPYREKIQAHQTIKLLMSSLKVGFDREVIKALINNMSVYPIGTIVTLQTKEVAKVIDVRASSPMRPVVMILKDAQGQPVQGQIFLDLSEPNSPAINSPI
ncbi:response regulator [Candidatus Omnitrophota bacterium]